MNLNRLTKIEARRAAIAAQIAESVTERDTLRVVHTEYVAAKIEAQQAKRRIAHAEAAEARRLRLLPLRRSVFLRDHGRCWLCGGQTTHTPGMLVSEDPLLPTLDHVIPVVEGGPDEIGNLRCAHQHCNKLRGSRSPFEAWMALRDFAAVHGTLDTYMTAHARFYNPRPTRQAA